MAVSRISSTNRHWLYATYQRVIFETSQKEFEPATADRNLFIWIGEDDKSCTDELIVCITLINAHTLFLRCTPRLGLVQIPYYDIREEKKIPIRLSSEFLKAFPGIAHISRCFNDVLD
ncbi:Hypothetical predicted protein [Octopus vulgaris]|uniref:Uncharacterized protein n=1 Tax=Octopus vulgaris TaxID=6645 RepID=A0AA36B8Q1_OCTVU|nr:Hypothetical predicted protein [Octopus vulgaris]